MMRGEASAPTMKDSGSIQTMTDWRSNQLSKTNKVRRQSSNHNVQLLNNPTTRKSGKLNMEDALMTPRRKKPSGRISPISHIPRPSKHEMPTLQEFTKAFKRFETGQKQAIKKRRESQGPALRKYKNGWNK